MSRLDFSAKDFIQLGVLVVSLIAFYFTSVNGLDRRIVRLEAMEEGLRRDIQEMKTDIREVLTAVRKK